MVRGRNVTHDCCGPKKEDAALLACPTCGTTGRPLPRLTLRTLAVEPAAIRDERYRFCASPCCDVVWFGEASGHVLHRSDVLVRVGVKETAADRPLCYCFGFTAADVCNAVGSGSGTPVDEAILAHCRRGEDRCIETNPQGVCCIANIRAVAAQ
jgi:hypothetical protein